MASKTPVSHSEPFEEGVIVADDNGRIVLATRKVATLWGRAQNELKGTALPELFSPRSWEQVTATQPAGPPAQISQLTGRKLRLEGVRGDGSIVPIALTCEPAVNGGGFVLKVREASSGDALEKKLRHLEKAFETMQIGVTVTDVDRKIIYVNPADAEMHGYTVEELLGQDAGLFAPGKLRQPLPLTELRRLRSWSRESVNVRKDGSQFPVFVTSDVVFGADGEPLGIVTSCQDISERKAAEEALRVSEERYALAVQGANDGLWDWDLEADEIYLSPRWKAMLGYTEDEVRDHPSEWLSRVHPDDRDRLQAEIDRHLERKSPHFENEHRILHRDGTYRWMRSRGLAVWDETGRAKRMAGSLADITELKVQDALTGLPNRALLMDRLGLALARAQRRPERTFAVLFLDLDRFKVVNDSLGHITGDHLLTAIARRLEHALRPEDTIARYGGDEFTILIEDISGSRDAVNVAERIHSELAQSFRLDVQEVYVTASIGIALHSPDYERPEDLLRDADLAMYRAKTLGRGRSTLFDTTLRQRAMALLQIETDLRRAIEQDELRLFYQPIFDLESGETVAFEALVRWQHPENGLLSPADFLPVAEENGLIVPLGKWVIREACRQMSAWQRQFPAAAEMSISVNLSAKQLLQPGLADLVKEVLHETGLEPRHLALEITETVLLDRRDLVIATLAELRQLGVMVCLDDFGTGYSFLSYLQGFPIDTLKIDRSFVKRLGPRGQDGELVGVILQLGRDLDMEVIAEGIETPDQLQGLKSLQCRFGQGFSFSRPLDAASTARFLGQRVLKEATG